MDEKKYSGQLVDEEWTNIQQKLYSRDLVNEIANSRVRMETSALTARLRSTEAKLTRANEKLKRYKNEIKYLLQRRNRR